MPAPAPETPAGDAEQHPSQLLALPNFLLHEVLGRLTSAADLAAAAASCCALRELVHSSSWPSIQRLEAHAWKPALPCSLRWAAGSCPQVGAVGAVPEVEKAGGGPLPCTSLSLSL